MSQEIGLIKRLTQVKYDYPDASEQQQAQGLLRMAWGAAVATLLGLILLLADRTSNPWFYIGSYPVGKNQITYFLICVLGLVALAAVNLLLGRGRLYRASVTFVIALFGIALLAYVPNQLTSSAILAFSVPVVASGVLLRGRGVTISVVATVVILIALFVLGEAGLLADISTGMLTPVEAVGYGILILAVDGVILNSFVGRQRALLQHNLTIARDLESAVESANRASRAYRMLSDANQAVAYSTEKNELLQDVCQIAVEVGGYRLAWVGLLNGQGKSAVDPARTETVYPVAQAGAEAGYLSTIQAKWAGTEQGRGAISGAIGTSEPYVVQDVLADPGSEFWRDEAVERGHGSFVILPLVMRDRSVGTLSVYADLPGTFDEQELDLLHRLAGSLARGIGSLRAREERGRLQQEVIEAQRQAIEELSTPVIPIMEQIIVAPLVGNIDSLRARDITRALLAGIREHQARVVILDITGVAVVDSGVADHLSKTIRAARLKGTRVIVTGISDAVAETIVDLGIDWRGIETLGNLQTGLVAALKSLGVRLVSG